MPAKPSRYNYIRAKAWVLGRLKFHPPLVTFAYCCGVLGFNQRRTRDAILAAAEAIKGSADEAAAAINDVVRELESPR